MPGPGGCGTKGLGQEGLADTDGTDEEDVLPLREEVQGEELVEVTAVDLDGVCPVEVVEGDAFLEAGRQEPPFERKAVAALDLVGKDEGEEGGVVEFLGAREGEAIRERRHHLPQLEAFEETEEVGLEVHTAASVRRCWRWSKASGGRAKRLPSGSVTSATGRSSASRARSRMRWRRRTSMRS